MTLTFTTAQDGMQHEKVEREGLAQRLLPFGIRFCDKALRGILPQDLLLVGALPGNGKTEFVNTIALTNVAIGKKVHVFALEAERYEWERRMKYKVIINRYFTDIKERRDKGDFPKPEEYIRPNYLNWYLGDYDHILKKYEDSLGAFPGLENLYIFYRANDHTKNFGINELRPMLLDLQGQSDLVIIDHIHFFDFFSENENKEMADVFKQIRDLSLLINIPVIVIAHLRKLDKRLSKLVPDLDDFHGTSNLGKICSKAIILHPGGLKVPHQYYTYINIVKVRIDGSRTKFIGRGVFNAQTTQYENEFTIGNLSKDGKEFVPVEDTMSIPDWLKGVSA